MINLISMSVGGEIIRVNFYSEYRHSVVVQSEVDRVGDVAFNALATMAHPFLRTSE